MAQGGGNARIDGRKNDELRPVTITPGYLAFAEGSALIEMGMTKVLCSATVDDRVPPFMRGEGKGWVTAEYAMLPRSSGSRIAREGLSGRPRGRTQEIQRLIGRCLRGITDRETLGERALLIDCDVIQADGGTRTAAITGAYVALYQALLGLTRSRLLPRVPLTHRIAAVSVGLVDGELLLDLCYGEDSRAEVDFNIAMTDAGELVELQGATEGAPFPRKLVDDVLASAEQGIARLFEAQAQAIATL